MTFMNNTANIKQFQLIKFINENCDDDHVICKISITLRRDKIEAPYYIISNIKLSSCIDRPENGLIHAMDLLKHQRMHNLTEDTYNEIESLIKKANDNVEITEKQVKLSLMSKNDEEYREIFKQYGDIFDKIDNLIV